MKHETTLPLRDFYGNFLNSGSTVVQRTESPKPNRKGRIGMHDGKYHFIPANGEVQCHNEPINTNEEARKYIVL